MHTDISVPSKSIQSTVLLIDDGVECVILGYVNICSFRSVLSSLFLQMRNRVKRESDSCQCVRVSVAEMALGLTHWLECLAVRSYRK